MKFRILESLMPSYPSTSKLDRMEFKQSTERFLENKIGSLEPQKKQYIIEYVHDSISRMTLGIPKYLESEYKKMMVKELRKKYGSKQVAIQDWELV